MGTLGDELQVYRLCLPNEIQNKISDSQWTAKTKKQRF